MSIRNIVLPTESDPSRFPHAGNGRLINCYSEPTPNGKNGNLIVACDGLDNFTTLDGDGPVRALFAYSDSEMLAASGRLFCRMDVAGSSTVIGAIPTDGLVTMGRNRVGDVAIVSNGLYYKYQGGVFSKLEDPELPPPTSVAAGDGYFIFQIADGRLFSSELDDTNVLSTDFLAADTNPDPGVRVIRMSPYFISFGTKSYEVFRDVGGEAFPLDRQTSRNVGLIAAGAVTELDLMIAWVANDCTVRIMEGYDGKVISSDAVTRSIEDEPDKSSIVAYQYASRGHRFLAISGTSFTWEFNVSKGRWHERQSYGLERHRVSSSCLFGNRWLFGDYETSKVYVGNPTSIGATSLTEQMAMVDFSDDGGLNFGVQTFHSIGRIGGRNKRVRRYRLGVTESRVYRLTIDAVTDAGDHSIMTVQTAPVHTFPIRDKHRGIRWDVVPGYGPQANERGVVACALLHGDPENGDERF